MVFTYCTGHRLPFFGAFVLFDADRRLQAFFWRMLDDVRPRETASGGGLVDGSFHREALEVDGPFYAFSRPEPVADDGTSTLAVRFLLDHPSHGAALRRLTLTHPRASIDIELGGAPVTFSSTHRTEGEYDDLATGDACRQWAVEAFPEALGNRTLESACGEVRYGPAYITGGPLLAACTAHGNHRHAVHGVSASLCEAARTKAMARGCYRVALGLPPGG
jgi:hypothetical protein